VSNKKACCDVVAKEGLLYFVLLNKIKQSSALERLENQDKPCQQ
jgi:hypothetical protein